MCELAGHPHDPAENAVDIGHFAPVHGFVPEEMPTASFDGPTMKVPLGFSILIPLLGKLRVQYETYAHGLGHLVANIHLPVFGPVLRVFVLPIVVSPGRMQLRIAAQLALPGPRWLPPPVRNWVALTASRALARVALRLGVVDVLRADNPIWATKQYLARPRLAEGDGPIPQYRRWARQFYPEGLDDNWAPYADNSATSGDFEGPPVAGVGPGATDPVPIRTRQHTGNDFTSTVEGAHGRHASD